MVGWQTGGRTAEDNNFRQLLCDYVEFLLLTGCRHGTEAMGVCWQHCEWYVSDGVRYLRVWVDGKTGGRWLIAKHELATVLLRLHSRQQDIADKGFDSVLGRHKAYLFRTSDGRRPYSFNGLFRRLLRYAELLTNAAGEARTLYSLRHTYATAELLASTDIHTLAKQMGTSVAMLERHYSKLTATLAAGRLA
jgi:integrase